MSSLYTDNSKRIHALVHAILQFIESQRGHANGIDQVSDKTHSIDLSLHAVIDAKPCDTRHATVLAEAIENITAPHLTEIAHCLRQARHDLNWREDNAQFYHRSLILARVIATATCIACWWVRMHVALTLRISAGVYSCLDLAHSIATMPIAHLSFT